MSQIKFLRYAFINKSSIDNDSIQLLETYLLNRFIGLRNDYHHQVHDLCLDSMDTHWILCELSANPSLIIQKHYTLSPNIIQSDHKVIFNHDIHGSKLVQTITNYI